MIIDRIGLHSVMLVHLHVNKTNFPMQGFALGLALKQRRKTTQKSPIIVMQSSVQRSNIFIFCCVFCFFSVGCTVAIGLVMAIPIAMIVIGECTFVSFTAIQIQIWISRYSMYVQWLQIS